MKKRILIGSILVVLVVMIIVSYCTKKEVVVVKETNDNKSNLISLMIETGVDTNKYNASTTNEWPGIYYEINKEKSGCENGGTLIYNKKEQKISMKNNVSDKCYVYFDKVTLNLSTHIKSLFNGQGENHLYYHNATLANSANDNSYRFSGKKEDSMNNYVCFGSTASPCPDDNLYRIVGVFNSSIKLVKEVGLDNNKSFKWNENRTNVWEGATLNTYLNDTYLTSLGTWANYIKISTWNVGTLEIYDYMAGSNKPADAPVYTAKYLYDAEIAAGTTSTSKIALLSVSDFGFTTIPANWTKDVVDDYYAASSWLYPAYSSSNNLRFWLINPVHQYDVWDEGDIDEHNNYVFIVWPGSKYASADPYLVTGNYYVKPAFYLNANVEIKDGNGTIDDPYIINV